ncbi:MAG TPA: DUF1629 domain-containing protein [Longimicrobium sp.]
MSKLTIGEMIEQVPEGQAQTFERSIADPGEERYLKVSQNWDYHPERKEWLNYPSSEDAPWFGTRLKPRISLSRLARPNVRFKGPSEQVVDLYSSSSHAFFISDKLFRMIEGMDPGSLEHIGFELRAKDGVLPFRAVMPRRHLEAIDTRRTTVRIEDKALGGQYFRKVLFPEGIVFDNDVLQGVSSFSDLDARGWFWSKDLIAEAKSQGIRGISAASPASAAMRRVVESF